MTFVHLVVVGARRHRREQAILRSLGFTPQQARLSSTMHSGVLAAVTLLVGVPLGLWMGSRAWRTISSELTVTPRLFAPTWLLAGGTVVALACAAGPGRDRRRAALAGPAGSPAALGVGLEDHDRPQHLTTLHAVERLLDTLERDRVADEPSRSRRPCR